MDKWQGITSVAAIVGVALVILGLVCWGITESYGAYKHGYHGTWNNAPYCYGPACETCK